MTMDAVLARTMVELADTLVADFDVVDLLTLLTTRSVDLLEVDEAGLLIAGVGGDLRTMASSSDQVRLLDLFQLQAEEGPCLDCVGTGERIVNRDMAEDVDRWPRFAVEARAAGFSTVHAIPMRLRGTVLGALNLFSRRPVVLEENDILAAQALADIATIAILQTRAAEEAQTLAQQLSDVLNSRIIMEQAKGVVAERRQLSIADAFDLLRRHARNHNLRLAVLAQRVIDDTSVADTLERDMPRRQGR
jgi:GAF domain-containing protein